MELLLRPNKLGGHSFIFQCLTLSSLAFKPNSYVKKTTTTKTLNDSKHTFLVNFRVIPSDEPLTINISSNIIKFLEHVQIRVTLNFTRRGDLEMNLTSPLGTTSRLIQHRPRDSLTSLNNWTILTLQHWGENPAGVWKLTQKNFGPQYKNTGLSVWFIFSFLALFMVVEHDAFFVKFVLKLILLLHHQIKGFSFQTYLEKSLEKRFYSCFDNTRPAMSLDIFFFWRRQSKSEGSPS